VLATGVSKPLNFFIPFSEALSFRLVYSYRVLKIPWHARNDWEGFPMDHFSSKSNVITVITAGTAKKYVKTFQAGDEIILSVSGMLLALGESLDAYRLEAGRNLAPEAAVRTGPLAWISGLDFEIHLECSETPQPGMVFNRHALDIKGPTCYANILSGHKGWTRSNSRIDMRNDGARVRSFRGIRIKVDLQGAHRSVDINAIFLNLCASVVLLRIPFGILFIIGLWSLGHTSKIYRRAIYKDFDIAHEAGAMAVRVMSHAADYNQIREPKNCTITKDTMRLYFMDIMVRRGHQLDPRQIEHMVAFCLHTTNMKNKNESTIAAFLDDLFEGVQSIVVDIADLIKGNKSISHDELPYGLDLNSFESACSSAEPISFENFSKLFTDRKQRPLERMFQQVEVRDYLRSVREAVKKDAAHDGTEAPISFNMSSLKNASSSGSSFSVGVVGHVERTDQKLAALEERLHDLERRFVATEAFGNRLPETGGLEQKAMPEASPKQHPATQQALQSMEASLEKVMAKIAKVEAELPLTLQTSSAANALTVASLRTELQLEIQQIRTSTNAQLQQSMEKVRADIEHAMLDSRQVEKQLESFQKRLSNELKMPALSMSSQDETPRTPHERSFDDLQSWEVSAWRQELAVQPRAGSR
jgi:hypothetical protein